jgi:hypothetical protein
MGRGAGSIACRWPRGAHVVDFGNPSGHHCAKLLRPPVGQSMPQGGPCTNLLQTRSVATRCRCETPVFSSSEMSSSRLRPGVPILVAAWQHLVRRNLPVGLLVLGSPAGIETLRGHPAMGFISRAECVVQD